MRVHRLVIGFVVVCATLGCNRLKKTEEAAAASATVNAAPPSDDVVIKVKDRPLEKVKVVSAVASDRHIYLGLDHCKLDCSIFVGSVHPGSPKDWAIEDRCRPSFRVIRITLKGDKELVPGTYDRDHFTLGVLDEENGKNLLVEARSAKLELKSTTEGSFETDTGTKGSFKATPCKT